MRFWHIWILSGKRWSAIITTIIGGGLESSSRSLPFLFIAKKRDGAVQQRGLMSRFYSFWGTFSERENGVAYLFSVGANPQPGGQKGRHQGLPVGCYTLFPRSARVKWVLSSWDSSFLYFLVWRKSESGDRSERGERQRIFFTVGAHIVRLFSVLHKQNYVPMAIFHKQGTTNFVKNRLCGKILFSV